MRPAALRKERYQCLPIDHQGSKRRGVGDKAQKIAYDAAVGTLDRQYAALAALRARSGTVLAAAALVASFLRTPALRLGYNGFGLAAGIVGLVFVLAMTFLILWPYSWSFCLSGAILLEDHARPGAETAVEDLYAFLARKLKAYNDKNEVRLRVLHLCLQVACLALAGEAIASWPLSHVLGRCRTLPRSRRRHGG
jgi:hypothetical protein